MRSTRRDAKPKRKESNGIEKHTQPVSSVVSLKEQQREAYALEHATDAAHQHNNDNDGANETNEQQVRMQERHICEGRRTSKQHRRAYTNTLHGTLR